MKWIKAELDLSGKANHKNLPRMFIAHFFKIDGEKRAGYIQPVFLDQNRKDFLFKDEEAKQPSIAIDNFKTLEWLDESAETKTDFQIAWEVANTKDKPFFVDTIRSLINKYDKEITMSKFVEELNVAAIKWREKYK